jgi:hypothetical protein
VTAPISVNETLSLWEMSDILGMWQGAIQGPGEFAEGLILGVKSLFGHTVGGAAGAVSRITGAMGKIHPQGLRV